MGFEYLVHRLGGFSEHNRLQVEFTPALTRLFFLGGVVDVGKLIGQLSKSEKSRAEMEQQLADAVKTLNDVKEVSNKHSNSKDKLLASGVLFASAEGLRSF